MLNRWALWIEKTKTSFYVYQGAKENALFHYICLTNTQKRGAMGQGSNRADAEPLVPRAFSRLESSKAHCIMVLHGKMLYDKLGRGLGGEIFAQSQFSQSKSLLGPAPVTIAESTNQGNCGILKYQRPLLRTAGASQVLTWTTPKLVFWKFNFPWYVRNT